MTGGLGLRKFSNRLPSDFICIIGSPGFIADWLWTETETLDFLTLKPVVLNLWSSMTTEPIPYSKLFSLFICIYHILLVLFLWKTLLHWVTRWFLARAMAAGNTVKIPAGQEMGNADPRCDRWRLLPASAKQRQQWRIYTDQGLGQIWSLI